MQSQMIRRCSAGGRNKLNQCAQLFDKLLPEFSCDLSFTNLPTTMAVVIYVFAFIDLSISTDACSEPMANGGKGCLCYPKIVQSKIGLLSHSRSSTSKNLGCSWWKSAQVLHLRISQLSTSSLVRVSTLPSLYFDGS